MNSKRARRLQLLSIPYAVMMILPVIGVIMGGTGLFDLRLSLRHLGLLNNTILLAAFSSVLSSALGFFLALFIYGSFLSDKWYRFYFLFLLPIPFYVYALSYMYFERSLTGVSGTRAIFSGIIPSVFVETLSFLPISTLFALIGVESIPKEAIEAAKLYGNSNKAVFCVICKAVRSYLLAGMGLTSILSATEFSVPSMFQFNTYSLDLFSVYNRTGDATTVYLRSLFLIPFLVVPMTWLVSGIRECGFVRDNNPGVRLRLKGLSKIAACGAFVISLFQLFVPIIAFVYTSKGMHIISDAVSRAGDELHTSMRVSLLAALIALIIALFPAILISEINKTGLIALALVPMIIPGAIGAMALLTAVNRSPLYMIGRTDLLCAAGCAIRFSPIVVVALYIYRKNIDRNMIDAARVHATSEKQYLRLEYYMMLPGILLGFSLAFFMTYAEESILLVLMSPGKEALAVKIYNYLHYGASEYVSAFCLVSVTVIALVELVLVLIIRRCLVHRHA